MSTLRYVGTEKELLIFEFGAASLDRLVSFGSEKLSTELEKKILRWMELHPGRTCAIRYIDELPVLVERPFELRKCYEFKQEVWIIAPDGPEDNVEYGE